MSTRFEEPPPRGAIDDGALAAAHRTVRAEWETILREHAPRDAWTAATSALHEQGVFADIASAAAAGMPRSQKSELTTKLIRHAAPALAPLVPQPLVFLQRWLGRISARTTTPAEAMGAPRATRAARIDGRPKSEVVPARRRSRSVRADEAKRCVDKQKDAVLRALENDRVDLAARYAEELVRAQDDSGRADLATKTLCDLANRAKERGRLALAERWLDEAVTRAPNDPMTWNQIITLRRRQGQTREILAWSAQMLERFPDNVYAHTGRAEALRTAGRLHESCEVYDRTLELFPGNAFAQNARAVVLKGLGRLAEALASYDATLAKDPEDEFAHAGRAGVLKALGHLDQALVAYDTALARFPDRPWIRNWRAELLKQMGKLDEARAAYEENLLRFPRNLLTRNGLAATLVALGRIEDALRMSSETLKLFPEDLFARTLDGFVLAQAGRPDAARARYEAIRSRAPSDEHVRTGLGLLLVLEDQFNAAERLLADKPPTSTAREWFRLLGMGLLVLRRGDIAQAEAIFSRGNRHCPFARHRLRFESALALARMQRGDSLRVAKHLLALSPTEDALGGVTRRLVLAHALLEAERKADALEHLRARTPFGYRCVRVAEELLAKYAHAGDLTMAEQERLWDAELELLTL